MLQANEVLVNDAVDKKIKKIQEERLKEKERKERIITSASPETEDVTENTTSKRENEEEEEVINNFFDPTINTYERPIMQMLVRYGEQQMCVVEGENGEDIPLTVIEYIYYSMKEDGFELQEPLYRQMLDEAMQHLHDEGFTAEHYFLNHIDPRLSSTAFDLSTDREQLSRIHGEQYSVHPAETVPPMIASLKLAHVRGELKQIIEQTKRPENLKDNEAFRALMERYNEKKHQADLLAKEAGDRVVLR